MLWYKAWLETRWRFLTGLGLPYVEGYKPRGNYQALHAQWSPTRVARRPTTVAGLSEAAMRLSVKTPDRAVQSHSFLLSGATIRFLWTRPPPQALAVASWQSAAVLAGWRWPPWRGAP
jgi:hypothetical protein